MDLMNNEAIKQDPYNYEIYKNKGSKEFMQKNILLLIYKGMIKRIFQLHSRQKYKNF